MKRFMLLLLLCCTLVGVWAGPVRADGMILPLTPEAGYLAVRYHHVTVEIDDFFAVTRVEQEFYNPHDFAVEGRYLFPIPPGAVLSDFVLEIDGERQEVIRQDGEATNAALFAAIEAQHDPSLLRYADWEALMVDLELPPGDVQTMVLEYAEALGTSGAMRRYHYVLSTEQYTAFPLEEVSVSVEIHSLRGLGSIYAPNHDVLTERLGEGRARVTWAAQQVQPGEDFVLFFAPAEAGFGAGLLTGTLAEREHFLFLFAPEQTERQDTTLPKDIVFVIDRSGSMQGEKMVQARDALQFILGQLGTEDRFSIVSFDDELGVFAPALRPMDGDSLAEARRFTRGLEARGSTDIDGALGAGLEILARSEARPGVPRLVVFLTDGLPTAGVTDEAQIAERARRSNAEVGARLHVFGVGYDVNTHLLDRLSAENSGSVTYVQPGENLEVVLADFYRRIADPVLTDVTLSFEGLEVESLYPAQLPDLFHGSTLMISGRYHATGDTAVVRVRGRAGERTREYAYTFDLGETGGHDFVPRLWATRRAGELLDAVRVEGESSALVEELRALGLDYGIVTPYTTFVIAAQESGAASMENMSLYERGSDLNQVFGEVTVRARVQNQLYQDASRSNLATGANVVQRGEHNLARVATQSIDLALLRSYDAGEGPITEAWIAANIQVDREVAFASSEYFALASDPELRPFLQAGSNVIFAYEGEIIRVDDPDAPVQEPVTLQPVSPVGGQRPGAFRSFRQIMREFFSWLWGLLY